MSELSLKYYVSISKGNTELLNTFKALLLSDFKSMDVSFFLAVEDHNVAAMREQLHKISPIAFNLNFSQMLDLIERYRCCDPEEFDKLHVEMKICLAKIYDFLKPD